MSKGSKRWTSQRRLRLLDLRPAGAARCLNSPWPWADVDGPRALSRLGETHPLFAGRRAPFLISGHSSPTIRESVKVLVPRRPSRPDSQGAFSTLGADQAIAQEDEHAPNRVICWGSSREPRSRFASGRPGRLRAPLPIPSTSSRAIEAARAEIAHHRVPPIAQDCAIARGWRLRGSPLWAGSSATVCEASSGSSQVAR